jgi:hypothetical protein
MTNSRLGTEILVPSPPRYTNNLAGSKDRAGHHQHEDWQLRQLVLVINATLDAAPIYTDFYFNGNRARKICPVFLREKTGQARV